MRSAALVLLLLSVELLAQDRILLNEVLPGNRGITTDSAGRTPDWIEVYNPTTKAVDLNGWRIAMAGRQHVFTAPLAVPPRSWKLLWCDGRTDEGSDHIAFKLAREGGALLLIAPDGLTITDVFSYPETPGNVSIGRWPDGAKAWSFFPSPTPGRQLDRATQQIKGVCDAPRVSHQAGVHLAPIELQLHADEGCSIRYTLDGTPPTESTGEVYTAPIAIASNTVVRAIAHAPQRLPSPVRTAAFIIGQPNGEGLALSLAPEDLWDDTTGIYTTGAFANNTRSGKEWERPGVLQRFGDSIAVDASVRISGSGSRGLRKRSFRLSARGELFSFADGLPSDEAALRADATPHAFLRNTTLEALVHRYGLHVAMQPSTPLPLYLNGKPWGLYRWMPAKDDAWLAALAGAEALDVLEGPAFNTVSGSSKHFLRAQELLVRGAPLDSITSAIDVSSLIDLACIDLWTGRADHELNVRCYRPRQPGGRWRWVLFDMDLWAPPNENSAQRMSLAAAPETPFVPQLLAHADLQEMLLARITALQATAFAQAADVADSIHTAHRDALLADHRRWELELSHPHPDSSLAMMKAFAAARPDHLFNHLARATGRKLRTVRIEAPTAELGTILLEGLPLAPGHHEVLCLSGVPLALEARVAPESEFGGWKGIDLEGAAGKKDISRARSIRTVFRKLVP